MTFEIKLIAGAVLLVVLCALGLWGHHTIYDQGRNAEHVRMQALWDADKQRIQALADAALAQALQDRAQAIITNQVIHDQYENALSTVAVAAGSLAERLHDAEAHLATNRSAVPATPDRSGPSSAGPPSGDAALTNAVAATFAECNANADQLDALEAQLNPQVLPRAHP